MIDARGSLRIALAAAIVVAVSVVAWRAARRDARPNVVLIVVDTLRADALGCYGARAGATPRIDELASRSTRFTRTLSPSNQTSSSLASIHTGLYLKSHGVLQLAFHGYKLDPSLTTFAERMKGAGYATLGAASVFHLGGEVSGLGRGFDVYLDAEEGAPKQPAGTTTTRVLDAIRAWRSSPDGSRPLFLFVHYFDPHWPYRPPPPFDRLVPTPRRPPDESLAYPGTIDEAMRREFADHFVAQYLGEVAYADREIGRFLDGLRETGLLREAIVLFTADHGENLGEHGLYFNHADMYRSVTNVPLMVSLPGETHGAVSDALAQGIDLLPTALDYAGVRLPLGAADGRSLRPAIERRVESVHDVIFSEASRMESVVAQDARRKLVLDLMPDVPESACVRLHDLAADPAESTNLADVERAASRGLASIAEGFLPAARLHLRFGPGGPRRTFESSIRGLKSSVVSAVPVGLEKDDRGPSAVAADGSLAFACEAGGGDEDGIVVEMDRAATAAVSLAIAGRPAGAEDLAVGEGEPLGQRWLTYAIEGGAGGAEPLAASSGSASLRLDDAGGHPRAFRLALEGRGVSRLSSDRALGDPRAEGEGGRVLAREGIHARYRFESDGERSAHRFSIAESPYTIFLSARVAGRSVAPADVSVTFPIRLAPGAAAIPFVTSAYFRAFWEPVPAEDPGPPPNVRVHWETSGRTAQDRAAADRLMPELRSRLEALGYAGEAWQDASVPR